MTENGNLRNVLRDLPEDEQYSFNFGGAAQLIDGILLSQTADETMVDVDIYHVNADFPEAWGENVYTVHRSADHDIPFVVLQLDGEASIDEATEAVVEDETAADDLDQIPTLSDEPEEQTSEEADGSSWLWWGIGILVLVATGIGTQWRRLFAR